MRKVLAIVLFTSIGLVTANAGNLPKECNELLEQSKKFITLVEKNKEFFEQAGDQFPIPTKAEWEEAKKELEEGFKTNPEQTVAQCKESSEAMKQAYSMVEMLMQQQKNK